jgi:hypothetical protein
VVTNVTGTFTGKMIRSLVPPSLAKSTWLTQIITWSTNARRTGCEQIAHRSPHMAWLLGSGLTGLSTSVNVPIQMEQSLFLGFTSTNVVGSAVFSGFLESDTTLERPG